MDGVEELVVFGIHSFQCGFCCGDVIVFVAQLALKQPIRAKCISASNLML